MYRTLTGIICSFRGFQPNYKKFRKVDTRADACATIWPNLNIILHHEKL